ncbi:MAG: hypothetical protein QGG54_17190 [Gammaproteobacteria bacterium]|jgi:hypothetical protein|nr:hypothetical protein [Chromatiales bacterium]MDP6416746.1 hypothetical protein [Gammaproteobacteria bacterium]MDP6673859.1 hypothetical protein [Gammaproteobacteria bacterium]
MVSNQFKFSAILLTLFFILSVFSVSAHAALEVIEEAYELNSTQILHWPLRAGDSFVIQPCVDCGARTLRVSDETRYATGFNTALISLSDLLRVKSQSLNTENHLIIVFFQPNDLLVTRIILQTDL